MLLKPLAEKRCSYKIIITIAVLFVVGFCYCQPAQLKYKIMQGGDEIGSMSASKTTTDNRTSFSMISEVKKKMILTLEVYEKHTALFVNDILSAATVLRKVNGKVKVDKQITCAANNCTVANDGKTSSSPQKPVYTSVLNIYFSEPEKIMEVYSDNFEKMIPLKHLGNHGYQLSLPDGDTVDYYYSNGVCSKVKVNKKLYDLEFVLVQ